MRQFIVLTVLFFSSISSAYATTQVDSPGSSGLLISPPGFFPLPTPNAASSRHGLRPQPQAQEYGLNLSNIQGDILIGMTKKIELFYFFGIQSPSDFKSTLATAIYPLITSTEEILTSPPSSVNIAFSNSGLEVLGITNFTSPTDPFTTGQANDAINLGDPLPIENNWVPAFLNPSALHGVFLIGAENGTVVNETLNQITSSLNDSIVEIYRLQASIRPGDQEGHEHFGFLDGLSQPGVTGFTTDPPNGQEVIPAGIILVGEEGDVLDRPAWAQDGSFLAFRQLEQLVPEFNKFLNDNALIIPGVTNTTEQGSELLGARMMGRWRSGAPVELSSLADNTTLAMDPNLNNNFQYNLTSDNTLCPFVAHTRKMYPRSDLDEATVDNIHRIIRAGIPYGPEVTDAEIASNTTMLARGLAFVSYQSNIAAGFRFLQQDWSNNPAFLGHPGYPEPGYDPISGANYGQERFAQGLNPINQTTELTMLMDFVTSRGGEYFFSPSLSAILGIIAA